MHGQSFAQQTVNETSGVLCLHHWIFKEQDRMFLGDVPDRPQEQSGMAKKWVLLPWHTLFSVPLSVLCPACLGSSAGLSRLCCYPSVYKCDPEEFSMISKLVTRNWENAGEFSFSEPFSLGLSLIHVPPAPVDLVRLHKSR